MTSHPVHRRRKLIEVAIPLERGLQRITIRLACIDSGDHSFKPIRSSGLSEAENWATAVGR